MSRRQPLDEVLKSLCEGVADFADSGPLTVNSVGASGDTPLHVAINRADLPAAEVLLKNGANVNGCREMTETPLHAAIRQRNATAVHLLLAHGARLDTRSEFGRTPAEEAAHRVNEATQILQMVQSDRSNLTCSFCGRSAPDKETIIESSFGGRICESCIKDLPNVIRRMNDADSAA